MLASRNHQKNNYGLFTGMNWLSCTAASHIVVPNKYVHHRPMLHNLPIIKGWYIEQCSFIYQIPVKFDTYWDWPISVY